MESLKIGMALQKKLVEDASVAEMVGDRVFPIAITKGTTLPFVVFQRTDCGYAEAKEKFMFEQWADFAITAVSRTYAEGVELMDRIEKVFHDFEGKVSVGDNVFDITEMRMISCGEDYDVDNDVFAQNMLFHTKIVI